MPVALVGAVQNNADSSTGWQGALESELFYQGTGSIGGKTGNGTTTYYHTGTARNFTVGGANEGDHIIVNFGSLTPGKLLTKANGGLSIRVEDTGTSNWGYWYVDGSDSKPATSLFLPYIGNPSADFDEVSGFTATGNPAQLSAVDRFGVAIKQSSGIMGNFNNSLVDQITIGKGLELTGSGDLEDFVVYDEGTVGNRFGFLTTNNRVIYMQGRFYVGNSSTSANLTDILRTIVFPDVSVADDFMGITTSHASTVLDFQLVSMSNAGGPQFDLDLREGTSTLKTCPIVGCRQTQTNVNTILDSCVFAESGPIIINTAATLTDCSFLSATAAPMISADTADSLDNVSGCSFDGAAAIGHGIEIKVAGTYDLNNISAANFGADDTSTAFINNTSGGQVNLNLINGTIASEITVNPSASTTAIQSVALTLNGLADDTQIAIRNTADDAELFFDADVGIDGATTYSYGASEVGLDAMIVVMSLTEEPASVPITLPGQDQSLTLIQTNDRTYSNPT